MKNDTITNTLQNILKIEYGFVSFYPQLAALMSDQDASEKLKVLGEQSAKHAETVRQLLASLTKELMAPQIESMPPRKDIEPFIIQQLEYEKLAMWLYKQLIETYPTKLPSRIHEIALEEESHIKLLEQVIQRLKPK